MRNLIGLLAQENEEVAGISRKLMLNQIKNEVGRD
jgi:hypothetical protein